MLWARAGYPGLVRSNFDPSKIQQFLDTLAETRR
jgi:hypothetical protein